MSNEIQLENQSGDGSTIEICDRAAIEPLQAASNQEAEQTVKGTIDLGISQIQNVILKECGDE